MVTLDPRMMAQTVHADSRRVVDEDAHRAVMTRASLLPPRDELLLRLVYSDQLPVRRVGLLLGIPAGTVSRKARRLYRRLEQPLAAALLSPRNQLPVDVRDIAIGYFVLRKRMNHLSAEFGKPVAQVKAALDFIRGWWRAASQRRALE